MNISKRLGFWGDSSIKIDLIQFLYWISLTENLFEIFCMEGFFPLSIFSKCLARASSLGERSARNPIVFNVFSMQKGFLKVFISFKANISSTSLFKSGLFESIFCRNDLVRVVASCSYWQNRFSKLILNSESISSMVYKSLRLRVFLILAPFGDFRLMLNSSLSVMENEYIRCFSFGIVGSMAFSRCSA